MNPFTAYIPLIATVISSIVTITGIIVLLRHKTETLEKNVERDESKTEKATADLRQAIDSLTRDLQQALMLVKINAGEQAIINRMLTETLNSLNNKCTEVERHLNAHTTQLALLEAKVNDGD